MSKMVSMDALRSTATRTQNAISEVAELALGAASAEYYTATIPTNAWVSNTDTAIANEGYNYMANVAVDNITTNDGSETEIAISSRSIALSCGMASLSQTITGYIRYYSISIPSESISIQIQVLRAASSV